MFSGRPFKSYGKFLDTKALYEKTFYGPSAAVCLEFGSGIQLLDGDYPGKTGVWNLKCKLHVLITVLKTMLHNLS
jgi:hypothetical protein